MKYRVVTHTYRVEGNKYITETRIVGKTDNKNTALRLAKAGNAVNSPITRTYQVEVER